MIMLQKEPMPEVHENV